MTTKDRGLNARKTLAVLVSAREKKELQKALDVENKERGLALGLGSKLRELGLLWAAGRLPAVFALVTMLAWACGGAPGTNGSYSCDYTSGGVRQCDEYSSLPSTDTAFSADCATAGGTAGSTCPRAGSVGSCQYTEPDTTANVKSFYYANAATQMRACTMNGVADSHWVAP